MAAVWKLLALVAVLMMPFGMTAASAAPVQHPAAMGKQHCPEPKHDAFGECTMACAAALPAIAAHQHDPLPIARAPLEAGPVQQLHGLHPDPATPPPRLS